MTIRQSVFLPEHRGAADGLNKYQFLMASKKHYIHNWNCPPRHLPPPPCANRYIYTYIPKKGGDKNIKLKTANSGGNREKDLHTYIQRCCNLVLRKLLRRGKSTKAQRATVGRVLCAFTCSICPRIATKVMMLQSSCRVHK